MLSISDDDTDILSPVKSKDKKSSEKSIVESTDASDGASAAENKEGAGRTIWLSNAW